MLYHYTLYIMIIQDINDICSAWFLDIVISTCLTLSFYLQGCFQADTGSSRLFLYDWSSDWSSDETTVTNSCVYIIHVLMYYNKIYRSYYFNST